MKLVTYDDGKVGYVDGEEIVRLDVPTMREWFERGGADETGERTPLAEAKLRAPIVPKKFFHTAGNFREHEEESKNVNWTHRIAPWINFFQNVDAIIGPDEPIVYPEHLTEELDYELELAVVLKKAGKWFSPEEAEDYIGGYVIFNDITARDIQRGEMRSGVFSFCKAIDTFCPLGPWIVTPDEIPDPHDLAMELRVNGETRQESNTSQMSVTIPEILSNFSALGYSAGDVLSTGTVAGVAGFKSEEERSGSTSSPATWSRPRSSGSACCATRSSRGRRATASRRRRASAPGARTPSRSRTVALRVARSVHAYARFGGRRTTGRSRRESGVKSYFARRPRRPVERVGTGSRSSRITVSSPLSRWTTIRVRSEVPRLRELRRCRRRRRRARCPRRASLAASRRCAPTRAQSPSSRPASLLVRTP